MKHITLIGGMALIVAFSSIQLIAKAGPKLAPGQAEVLYDFVDPDPGEYASPEGIAFDRNGNLFVTLRTTDRTAFIGNEVVKITSWGESSVLADLGPALPGGFGSLGLTTDPKGNVYVAFASFNENHGVWKIAPDGEMERLAGSEQIIVPNSLTFDKKGNLYVTDYDPLLVGTIGVWRYGKQDRLFAPWAGGPLLLSAGTDPLGNPLGGANGIAFDPPNNLYVANTQRNLVAHVPIMNNGSAGTVSLVAAGPLLINPDGLTVDTKGNIYAVIPVASFPQWFADMFGQPPLSPVVRIVPDTGEVQPVLDVNFPDEDYFDMPTSLAFGAGPWDKKSVYIVGIGAANYGFPFGTGPKLTQVGVGVPGRTGQ